jgi:hypothetical protein
MGRRRNRSARSCSFLHPSLVVVTFDSAHALSGGGGLENVALAAGLILLGLAFLVQKSLDRRVSIALLGLGLVLFIGSFTFLQNVGGGDTITVQGQEFETSELVDAVTAMCTARDDADDKEGAQATFLNRAHIPLHVIAAALEDEDRALAGRLLEVKQGVEEEFAGDADPKELADGLDELITVTAEALNVLGIEAATC